MARKGLREEKLSLRLRSVARAKEARDRRLGEEAESSGLRVRNMGKSSMGLARE